MKITEYKKKDGSVVYRSSVYLGIDTVTGKKVKTTISDRTKNRLKRKAIQAKIEFDINATIRMHTFGNLKMYKIDSAVIMILR